MATEDEHEALVLGGAAPVESPLIEAAPVVVQFLDREGPDGRVLEYVRGDMFDAVVAAWCAEQGSSNSDGSLQEQGLRAIKEVTSERAIHRDADAVASAREDARAADGSAHPSE